MRVYIIWDYFKMEWVDQNISHVMQHSAFGISIVDSHFPQQCQQQFTVPPSLLVNCQISDLYVFIIPASHSQHLTPGGHSDRTVEREDSHWPTPSHCRLQSWLLSASWLPMQGMLWLVVSITRWGPSPQPLSQHKKGASLAAITQVREGASSGWRSTGLQLYTIMAEGDLIHWDILPLFFINCFFFLTLVLWRWGKWMQPTILHNSALLLANDIWETNKHSWDRGWTGPDRNHLGKTRWQ